VTYRLCAAESACGENTVEAYQYKPSGFLFWIESKTSRKHFQSSVLTSHLHKAVLTILHVSMQQLSERGIEELA